MAGPARSTTAAASSRHEEYKSQPPRPRNAWILYRSDKFALLRNSNERLSQAEVSRRIAYLWKHESEEVKRYYEQLAEAEKLKHQQMYPDYRFCPQKREVKLRFKEEIKQNRRTKKAKARDATPSDATSTPQLAALPIMPQPYHFPTYPPELMSSYLLPPEAYYGPEGPSPPISAAPSPVPCEASQSPHSEGTLVSSPSNSSIQPSTNSDLQLPSQSLPPSHTYAPQLPTLLFQPPQCNELFSASQQAQPGAAGDGTATVWNNIHAQLPNLQYLNSDVLNFDITVDQTNDFGELLQGISDTSSSHPMLSVTDANRVFSLPGIETSTAIVQVPTSGPVDIGMGAQAPNADYTGQFFADQDFVDFQQAIDSMIKADTSSSTLPNELDTLFRPSDDPDAHAHTSARQRQPSVFSQEVMSYLNLDALEGSVEDVPSSVAPHPTPSTVAPQQVRLQNAQQSATTPIFTQMTNTPTTVSGSSYVPPAGAIYSSTRRVGGTWKPSYTICPPIEDPILSWTLSTN